MNIAQSFQINLPATSTVACPSSPAAISHSPSVSAAPVHDAIPSLSPLSKRAQKGKKDPPGSRNRNKKARKEKLVAAVELATARAAVLSAELAESNTVLGTAVEARDSARSERDKAEGRAKEWQHKYRITRDAADRERLKQTKDRLLVIQRAQNAPSSADQSLVLPAPSSLLPTPYPEKL